MPFHLSPLLRRGSFLILATLLACVTQPALARESAPRIPGQISSSDWEADMRAFAATDVANPPPRHAVLFIGSSSIRMWGSLVTDFPGIAVINRGFGGSEIRDSTWYADRIVVPCRPRLIVFYAGENDLNNGRTPQQVRDDLRTFIARVRRDLPGVPIAYVSIKPSPSRAHLLPAIRQANALVRADLATMENASFIDVFTPMLGSDGQPRPSLYLPDRLHMTAEGYALWRGAIAPYLAPR